MTYFTPGTGGTYLGSTSFPSLIAERSPCRMVSTTKSLVPLMPSGPNLASDTLPNTTSLAALISLVKGGPWLLHSMQAQHRAGELHQTAQRPMIISQFFIF